MKRDVRLHFDMDENVYHASPALSSSGARKLLSSSPAAFRYQQLNPPPPKAEYDLGHAAHRLVLGAGPQIVECKFPNWMTKAAKQAAEDARAEGKVPLLTKDYQTVSKMAQAIARHLIAAHLLINGHPEVSMFYKEPMFDIECRARFDWLPEESNRRVLLSDYKTAMSASKQAITKAMYNYGYHQQGAWYLDALQFAGRAGPDAAFLLIVQEKTPPFLVNVVRIDPDAIEIGRQRNIRALEIYRDCTESGVWPGYESDSIPVIDLPRYAYRDEDE